MPIFFLTFLFLLIVPAVQADNRNTASTSVIKGDVLYWEEDELVVKEISGREIRLRVNGQTKIQGAAGKLKTGDKIEAAVTNDGQATAITLSIPDSGAPPSQQRP